VVADPRALPLSPLLNTGAQFIDHTDNFVPRNARILNSRPEALFRKHIATADATSVIRTSPALGFGISRSTTSNSPPGLGICAATIVVATFVVAKVSPKNFKVIAVVPSNINRAGVEEPQDAYQFHHPMVPLTRIG